MAEIFGVVSGAISVAALFNNCVGCFEYIQLGRHFAQDYERCQLKLDIARTRLSRWGQAVDINEDPRFATDKPKDESIRGVQEVLEQIDDLFQSLNKASKRYAKRAENDDAGHLSIQTMQPVAQRLHRRLSGVVAQRQKGTSLVKKAAWALYDGKNFDKLVKEVTEFVDALETLFPATEIVRRQLVEVEIEEIDDEPSLNTLQNAANSTDDVLARAVTKRSEMFGRMNHAEDVRTQDTARVRVGDEWAEAAVRSGLVPPGSASNKAGLVTAGGSSAVHIGSSYGGRGIFDSS